MEVTFSAPENRANLDATILEKDSVIKEVEQSSDKPERVCSDFIAWPKEEKVIGLPLLQAEEIFHRWQQACPTSVFCPYVQLQWNEVDSLLIDLSH